jgi:hypothetical protein
MAHDVFISYSTKDKTIADAVCAKLEENKIRVWIAPRDVPAGSKFAESIIRAINTCKVFVLIWSANTNASDHILNEINQAFDQGITIIPFRIQDIQPTDEMRYYFGRTHWLDAITPPLENHIAVLRDTILVNLGRELQLAKPAVDSQESSIEEIQPSVKPVTVEEPAIERAEAVKPPMSSPRQKKSQKIEDGIQPTGVAPANLTRLIPFAAGSVVVLTLVVLLLSGVFKGTSKQTETSTPTPAWIEDAIAVAEPILATIKNHQPDFEDDFSQVDPNWSSSPGEPEECLNASDVKMSITDGSMKYSIINCRVGDLKYMDMQYDNYVLQLDVNFQGAPLGFEFRNWGRAANEDVTLDYHIHHDAGWGFSVMKNGVFFEGMDGNYGLDFSKPVTITIINQSPTFIVYVNSSLLTFYSTQEEYDGFGLDFTVNSWNVTPTETLTLELDNIKIWDLDKIEEAIAFSESILATVQNLPPDFADDFSQVDPNWITPPGDAPPACINAGGATMNITDGSMKYGILNCQVGILQYTDMQYANYILQMDVYFQGAPLGLEFRDWGPSVQIGYHLHSPDGQWGFGVGGSEGFIEGIDGDTSLDFSKPFTITIVNRSPIFIVYLNSSLLTLYNTQETYAGPFLLDFTVNSWDVTPTETLTLELDNVKIWDLDKIEY